MKRILLTVIAFTTLASVATAQNGWKWPEDKATAEEKNALYTDALRLENYPDAIEPLQWLIDNAPDLNSSLYINGAKIYKKLANDEGDKQKKVAYQEKVLDMYDLRIKYFGDEAEVLDRKAYDAYKYYKDRKDKYKDLFELYERTFELNGENISSNNLVAYMDVIRRYKLTGGDINDDQVLERYDKIMVIVDKKIANGENAARLEKNKEFIDKMLTSVVTVDCNFIENKLGPKLDEEPDNVGLAKKIIGLSLASDCSGSPIFIKAAKVVDRIEPDFGIAKNIAIKAASAGNMDEALTYFERAIELADTDERKGDVLIQIASIMRGKGRKSDARKYANQAAAANPAVASKAYKLIGDLYYTSFDACKKGQDKVKDRAVFFAAYKMYQRAGDAKSAASAKSQFPSIEEIFEYNYKEGSTINVGCWINETVKIERRPQ
ncbi:MAG: tetratricopeptide repeat protein [Bacteroidota bacterium]